MAKGQSVAAAGNTVYFKGGTYAYDKGTTTCSSGTATVSGVVLSKSGSAGNLIKYWAAPGEKPVFDFNGILDSCRIKGILVSGSFIHLKGLELKGVRQNNDLNHESWGVWISGSNNVFEQLDIHHIMGAGLFIQQGGKNLVLNCDSHDNFDEHTSNGAGESADGFGCHIRAGDAGNVFRGCRAWWNADDGYDFINAFDACTVESSWAWYNGYRPGTMTAIGNGNGFKGGGYGADPTQFPANPARHTVRNCLAFGNRAAGFYANHHPTSCYFYNNTGYGNNPNFNMLGMSSSGADTTVGVYRNNISFTGSLYSNRNGADDTFNSWTVSGITLSTADFQSVGTTGMDAPRQADGSLPVLPNFHLATGSDLINKGSDVGLPFAGSAPDLGCFETGLAAGGGGGTGSGGAGSGGAGSGGTGGGAGNKGGAGTGSGAAGSGSGRSPGGRHERRHQRRWQPAERRRRRSQHRRCRCFRQRDGWRRPSAEHSGYEQRDGRFRRQRRYPQCRRRFGRAQRMLVQRRPPHGRLQQRLGLVVVVACGDVRSTHAQRARPREMRLAWYTPLT